MNGRRAIVGLCMACALLVSAFAAQSASAVPTTTAFTCKNVGNGGFSEDHCKTAQGGGSWGHVAIAAETTTSLRGRAVGESTLKSTVGGLGVTLRAKELEGAELPTMTNKLEGSEHYAHGEGNITYKGVTVDGFSEKCKVFTDEAGVKGAEGMVQTERLVATTKGVAGGMGLKFTPKAGGVFARFWILDKNKKTSAEGGECSIGATYVVSGSVIGTPEGATTTFTEAGTTAQNTLKMGPTEAGAKAGLEGQLTLEAEDTADNTDTWAPISATTVTE